MTLVYYQDLGNGMYTATLRIAGFKEEDANQRYLLVVENELGETEYKVRLSMDDAPKGKRTILFFFSFSLQKCSVDYFQKRDDTMLNNYSQSEFR